MVAVAVCEEKTCTTCIADRSCLRRKAPQLKWNAEADANNKRCLMPMKDGKRCQLKLRKYKSCCLAHLCRVSTCSERCIENCEELDRFVCEEHAAASVTCGTCGKNGAWRTVARTRGYVAVATCADCEEKRAEASICQFKSDDGERCGNLRYYNMASRKWLSAYCSEHRCRVHVGGKACEKSVAKEGERYCGDHQNESGCCRCTSEWTHQGVCKKQGKWYAPRGNGLREDLDYRFWCQECYEKENQCDICKEEIEEKLLRLKKGKGKVPYADAVLYELRACSECVGQMLSCECRGRTAAGTLCSCAVTEESAGAKCSKTSDFTGILKTYASAAAFKADAETFRCQECRWSSMACECGDSCAVMPLSDEPTPENRAILLKGEDYPCKKEDCNGKVRYNASDSKNAFQINVHIEAGGDVGQVDKAKRREEWFSALTEDWKCHRVHCETCREKAVEEKKDPVTGTPWLTLDKCGEGDEEKWTAWWKRLVKVPRALDNAGLLFR